MKKIQLKQVLRNKRFVLFTIILPIGWYIFFYQLQKGVSPSILLGIAVFIGVIGNSLATFSKRIASDIGFYSFESHFTSYSVKNYLWDQCDRTTDSEQLDLFSSASSCCSRFSLSSDD